MANDSDADDRDGLDVLGVLAEPTRRRVYDHVVANGDWVSRESVAAALGLERPTVAHHLDRLAGDGLLEVEFRRLTGRQGPGAGRPAKLYRRSRSEDRRVGKEGGRKGRYRGSPDPSKNKNKT